MKTTVGTTKENGKRIIVMDDAIFELRKKLWHTIFKEKGDLSDCDVAMALGIVQYELVHHIKEENRSHQPTYDGRNISEDLTEDPERKNRSSEYAESHS